MGSRRHWVTLVKPKSLLYVLAVLGIAGGHLLFSPRPIESQALHECPCNGGCENRQNYNDCGNGYCSWFCH